MNVIYKYKLCGPTIRVPQGALILSAGLDPAGDICVWARVNPDEPKVSTNIHVVGTGQEVPEGAVFVGTILHGPWVWHVFK